MHIHAEESLLGLKEEAMRREMEDDNNINDM